MKRILICLASLIIVITCIFLSAESADRISIEENAKAEYGSCLIHTYNSDYTVINKPTCTDKGMKYRTCSECGYKDIVETPKDSDNHTSIKNEWLYFHFLNGIIFRLAVFHPAYSLESGSVKAAA